MRSCMGVYLRVVIKILVLRMIGNDMKVVSIFNQRCGYVIMRDV